MATGEECHLISKGATFWSIHDCQNTVLATLMVSAESFHFVLGYFKERIVHIQRAKHPLLQKHIQCLPRHNFNQSTKYINRKTVDPLCSGLIEKRDISDLIRPSLLPLQPCNRRSVPKVPHDRLGRSLCCRKHRRLNPLYDSSIHES